MRRSAVVLSVAGRTALWLGGAALLGVTLAGCSAPSDAAPTPSAASTQTSVTVTSSTSTPAPTTLTKGTANAELQAYLDAWRTRGPAAASQTYLAADQHVSSDADAPHLASGRVIAVQDGQPTPNGLMFPVTLELAFDGDPIAWTEGSNDRFVYFTARDGDIPYQMSFATGP